MTSVALGLDLLDLGQDIGELCSVKGATARTAAIDAQSGRGGNESSDDGE